MLKISYKNLWKLLIDLEIDKKTLGIMANISASTLTKMMKSESVNLDILLRICVTLNCGLSDVVEFVPDKPKAEITIAEKS
jgi:DNA-binding Xre family transcriptional regulator